MDREAALAQLLLEEFDAHSIDVVVTFSLLIRRARKCGSRPCTPDEPTQMRPPSPEATVGAAAADVELQQLRDALSASELERQTLQHHVHARAKIPGPGEFLSIIHTPSPH